MDKEEERRTIQTHEDLIIYQKAFQAAMTIFELSKQFPVEERYSLTDQIRRSSRSLWSNLAEAWRKRRYKASFIAKLNDSEGEAAETQVWLNFAVKCNYWPEVSGLATWSFGMVITGSSSLTRVSEFIGRLNQEKTNTVKQRLKELWHSSRLENYQRNRKRGLETPLAEIIPSFERCSSSGLANNCFSRQRTLCRLVRGCSLVFFTFLD